MNLPRSDDGFEIGPADGGGKDAPPIGKVAVIVLVKRLEQRGEVVGGKSVWITCTGLSGPALARNTSMATRIGVMEFRPCDEP